MLAIVFLLSIALTAAIFSNFILFLLYKYCRGYDSVYLGARGDWGTFELLLCVLES